MYVLAKCYALTSLQIQCLSDYDLRSVEGKVGIVNKSARTLNIKTYNENDVSQIIPYDTYTIPRNGEVYVTAYGTTFIRCYVVDTGDMYATQLGDIYVFTPDNVLVQQYDTLHK